MIYFPLGSLLFHKMLIDNGDEDNDLESQTTEPVPAKLQLISYLSSFDWSPEQFWCVLECTQKAT